MNVKKPAERQKEMVSMFRSACLCICKVELMYFQRNQPLPKISRTEVSPFDSTR